MLDTPMRGATEALQDAPEIEDTVVWMILPLKERDHLRNLLIKQCRVTMVQAEMSAKPNAIMIPLMIPRGRLWAAESADVPT